MKKIFFLLVLIILSGTSIVAQNLRRIATAEYQKNVTLIDSYPNDDLLTLDLPVTLPVVFHLVYPKHKEAPSKEEVQWQVNQLNKHFSLEEFAEKSSRYGYNVYHDLAVDTEIRFCLEKVFFIPSDSISFAGFNSIKHNQTKGSKPFKPEEYINIWVGELSSNSGFAQLPGGLWESDGIVIDNDFFGPNAPTPYHEGKTLTHLMANYLGLLDLWDLDQICRDDGVEDTPIHNSPNNYYVTPNPKVRHISTCYPYQLEMYMNYMDNSIDSLLYMFTEGQKMRMHSNLKSKRSFLVKNGCKGDRLVINNREKGNHELKLYPNPTDNSISISVSSTDSDDIGLLKIFNIMGRLVFMDEKSRINQSTIDISKWSSGYYRVTIDTPTLSLSNSFIKIK